MNKKVIIAIILIFALTTLYYMPKEKCYDCGGNGPTPDIRIHVQIFCTSKCIDWKSKSCDFKDQVWICNKELEKNASNSPCLSDHLGGVNSEGYDWVCDVAHNPRQPIDDLPENQCSAFLDGTAKHFVEVDENCELIRAV